MEKTREERIAEIIEDMTSGYDSNVEYEFDYDLDEEVVLPEVGEIYTKGRGCE